MSEGDMVNVLIDPPLSSRESVLLAYAGECLEKAKRKAERMNLFGEELEFPAEVWTSDVRDLYLEAVAGNRAVLPMLADALQDAGFADEARLQRFRDGSAPLWCQVKFVIEVTLRPVPYAFYRVYVQRQTIKGHWRWVWLKNIGTDPDDAIPILVGIQHNMKVQPPAETEEI